jgi:hypothetical protein
MRRPDLSHRHCCRHQAPSKNPLTAMMSGRHTLRGSLAGTRGPRHSVGSGKAPHEHRALARSVRSIVNPISVHRAPAESTLDWLEEVALEVHETLAREGAVLLRGLRMRHPDELVAVRAALRVAAYDAGEIFAARSDLGSGVTTPLRWPSERRLCHTHEGSFIRCPAAFVLTACIVPPVGGGHALLADTRKVASLMPTDILQRAQRHGWTLIRNFHKGFGISWQAAFLVDNDAQLRERLNRESVAFRWNGSSLHTTRTLPAIVDHPLTREPCWFNDLSFLNSASLDARDRMYLTSAFGAELPVETTFGDGRLVTTDEVEAIQRAYEAATRQFIWEEGDLLVTDNILTAQGRTPLEGKPTFMICLGQRSPEICGDAHCCVEA